MFETKPYLTTSDIRNRLDIAVGTNKISKSEADKIIGLLQLDYEESKSKLSREDGFIEDCKALFEYYNAKIAINAPNIKWDLLFDGFSYSGSEAMYIEPSEMDNLRRRHRRGEYFKRVVPILSKRIDINQVKPILKAIYNVNGFHKVTDKHFKEMVSEFRHLNDELSQQ